MTTSGVSTWQFTPSKIFQAPTYLPGQKSVVPIPRDMAIRNMMLRLSGTFNQPATPVTPPSGGISSLIQSLSLVGNGGTHYRDISGKDLVALNYLCNNFIDNEHNAIGNLASTAYPIVQDIPLWMLIPFAGKPLDAVLNAQLLNSLQLSIQWSNVAQWSNVNCGLFAECSLFGTPGLISNSVATQIGGTVINGVPNVASGDTAATYDLPTQRTYDFIMLHYMDATTGADVALKRNTNGINNVLKIRAGTYDFTETDIEFEKTMNAWRNRNGQIRNHSDVVSIINALWNNVATAGDSLDSYFFLQFPKAKALSESLPTQGLQNISLKIPNTTGVTCNVGITWGVLLQSITG